MMHLFVGFHSCPAALLRHGDGQTRLRDSVHGGAQQRRVQGDVAGDARLGADLGGDHFAECRDEQNIVERQGFGNGKFNHRAQARMGRRGSRKRFRVAEWRVGGCIPDCNVPGIEGQQTARFEAGWAVQPLRKIEPFQNASVQKQTEFRERKAPF